MTETSEQARVEVKSVPRPPVKWQVASVKDGTVTVIFPSSLTAENTNSEEGERG